MTPKAASKSHAQKSTKVGKSKEDVLSQPKKYVMKPILPKTVYSLESVGNVVQPEMVNSLNEVSEQSQMKYISVRELKIGEWQKIHNAYSLQTKYGPAVKIILENGKCFFLPRRYAEKATGEKYKMFIGLRIQCGKDKPALYLGGKTQTILRFSV